MAKEDTGDNTPCGHVSNLWAPWRAEYISSLADDNDECFLCLYREDSDNDEKNLVLWRGRRCMTVLNRFPYTGGHVLVAPQEHVAALGDLDAETMLEMMEMLRDAQAVATEALAAHGFNVGINIGRCAGAGLPGHIHAHLVPRWRGDTNFMSVCGDVRVIPTSLAALYEQFRQVSERLGLPKLAAGDAKR